MIEHSFIFLDKLGEQGERNLWSQGITTWQQFLSTSKIRGISTKRKLHYDRQLHKAKKAVLTQDHTHFKANLSQKYHWRLYNLFKSKALYLDIETDQTGNIIMVGLYDGFDTKTMVKGFNLDPFLLQEQLNSSKMLITFNGSAFDLPKLAKEFNLSFDLLHFDLKHACDKLGLTGGLKQVETQLDLRRPKYLKGNPVELWKAWHASGDNEYLQLLIEYNEEDVINLQPLANRCFSTLYALQQEFFT